MASRLMTYTVGIVVILLIILAAYNSSLSGNVVANDKPVIKIGISAPLSGGVAFIGEGMKNSFELALEEANKKDTKFKYELIFEDDALDPKQATLVAQKLINVDNVDAIISISSGPGNVIAPLAEQSKTLHVSSASDSAVAKGEYNFLHWTTPQEENRVLVEELQKRGIKKVAILELNQQGVVAIVEDFKSKIVGTDIEIVSEEKFNFGDKDFKTIIAKSQESNPDIYLLEAFSPELEIIAKQMKELGVDTPVTSVETFEFTEQPDLFEGMWYVQAADATQEFVDLYTSKYGSNPTLGAPNSFDELNIIINAFENAKNEDGKKPQMKDVLTEMNSLKNYKGALGTLNMGEEGIIQSKAVVREVKDGKFVTISAQSLN